MRAADDAEQREPSEEDHVGEKAVDQQVGGRPHAERHEERVPCDAAEAVRACDAPGTERQSARLKHAGDCAGEGCPSNRHGDRVDARKVGDGQHQRAAVEIRDVAPDQRNEGRE